MEEKGKVVPAEESKAPDVKSSSKRYSEIFRDFDKLELCIANATVGDLFCDPDTESIAETVSLETAENTEQEELTPEDGYVSELRPDGEQRDGPLSAQDADLTLCHCEGGVEMALQYAKMWCKYAKDLLAWMDKRLTLEQEYAKNVIKAADAAKSCILQQETMPMQYIYTRALEQDVKNSTAAKNTGEVVHNRCYQALAAKKNEIDKWRREFKEQWAREQRKMNEAQSALKKARQQYVQRCEELEKAKAMSAKAEEDVGGYKTLDKRRKSRDEAHSKMREAEVQYKQCVTDANAHLEELQKAKEKIIVHTRKLIFQGDTVLKEVTVNMFFFQRQQTEPVPLAYHSLEETCRPYEAGEPYLLYIQQQQRWKQSHQTFRFQEYTPSKKSPTTARPKTSNPNSSFQESYSLLEDSQGKRHSTTSDSRKMGQSDSESIGGSMESLTSPAHGNWKASKAPSTGTMSSDDLDEKEPGTPLEGDSIDESNGSVGSGFKLRTSSRAALTHRLRKTKSKMAKCRQCDTYILVSGIECEECGLMVHRKCLDVCPLECEHRKGILFGVDFSMLLRDCPEEVPFVVQQCTAEIEARALTVQGVYRVSGSKPRIQKLCQAFETQKDQVDLSDLSPHDITSVLKYFFKELPEPLMTFELYGDFTTVGKEIQRLAEKEPSAEMPGTVESIVQSLRELLAKLPQSNYKTLQHMIAHLYRVSEQYEENKMSSGNLGIIFGPTLLRPLVSGDVSMVALLETSYQAVLVEFLITHQSEIFGPEPATPAKVTSARGEEASFPQDTKPPTQERPQSLESDHKIKGDSGEGYILDKSSSNEAVDRLCPEANEKAGLAVSGLSLPPPAEPISDEAPVGTQRHSPFSRQPAKYQRQPVLVGTVGMRKGPAGLAEGSRNNSRSSSPEPGPLRTPRRRLEITPETARLLNHAGHVPTVHPSVQRATEPDRSDHKGDVVDVLGGQKGPGLNQSIQRHPVDETSSRTVPTELRSDSSEEIHFV